jgi:hypothetical protein
MRKDKFPRTMEEACGPGHRGKIYSKPEPMHKADKIIVWILAVVAVGLLALVLFNK